MKLLSFDVGINRPVIDINLIVISGVHQLISGFHITGTIGKTFQNKELSHGQAHRVSVPRTSVTVGVKQKLTAADNLVIAFLRGWHFNRGERSAAQHGFYSLAK